MSTGSCYRCPVLTDHPLPDALTRALTRAESLIAETPDYPEPGVLFRDISPVLVDAAALGAVTEAMIAPFAGTFDVVAGIEARGFLLAGTIAATAGVGTLPIRKAGKLPNPAASIEYHLEYGSAAIEAPGVLPSGARVLLVDDILATGGTLEASAKLLHRAGLHIAGFGLLMELTDQRGRGKLGGHRTRALYRV